MFRLSVCDKTQRSIFKLPAFGGTFFDTDLLGAAFGRNQIQKLKCKMQNFGILASQDNSLLFQQLNQPVKKNVHKKQGVERLYYRLIPLILSKNTNS